MYTIAMNAVINTKGHQKSGQKLREIRERKNLSQKDVADLAKMSVTYYAGIERGEENPTVAVLEQICKVLHIKSSQILPF